MINPTIQSNIRLKIREWDTYLPAVKNQSIDVLTTEIIAEFEKLVNDIQFEVHPFFIESKELEDMSQTINKYFLPKIKKHLLDKLRKN